jgi:NOL1/NOP2/sun family putative RNA methylase
MTTLPEKFIDRLTTFVPKDLQSSVLTSFENGKKPSFRVNTIKTSVVALLAKLTTEGFITKPVSWYNDAFILENKTKSELLMTKVYQEGLFYMQNLSSMIPPLVLNPQETDSILDMAASPGSKTTQIATLMHNKGKIIANDKSRQRVFKLKANLDDQGVTNTQTLSLPGEFLWRKFPEVFDKVLLDAPCSMEGRISLLEPDSYKDWSSKKIKQLANLQKWLIRSAVSCVKVGGEIVYSTCALSPEENEEVIDWILEKTNHAVIIEKIHIEKLQGNDGLGKWRKKQFHESIKNCLRIYPSSTMEGFFVAKLTKIKSTF